MTTRRFIAHRGVHLGGTIAGENSLEAIGLARRAGFECVEADNRLSADGELVVMHDDTLNRTATDASGRELAAPVRVSEPPGSTSRTESGAPASSSGAVSTPSSCSVPTRTGSVPRLRARTRTATC